MRTQTFQVAPDGLEAGFTLLELLVFIALASLVMAATPSLYGSLVPNVKVRQFASDIADAARTLRLKAQSDGQVHIMHIVDGGNTVLVDGESLEGPSDVSISYDQLATWKSATADEIEFYPNGATSGGALTLSRGNIAVNVAIDWMSGAVEVSR